jgi:hypothetical protein
MTLSLSSFRDKYDKEYSKSFNLTKSSEGVKCPKEATKLLTPPFILNTIN